MSDKICTFNYANENFDSYRRPDVVGGPTTNECMTKADFLSIYEGDDSLLVDYQGNQLVPISKCKSGYKCDESYIRTIKYHSSESINTFKINVKENILPFELSGLDLLSQLDIVTYDRIDKSSLNKIGIIADDPPEEFLAEDKCAVDLYKTVFIQAKAIQELKAEIDKLKK